MLYACVSAWIYAHERRCLLKTEALNALELSGHDGGPGNQTHGKSSTHSTAEPYIQIYSAIIIAPIVSMVKED